MTKTKKLPNGRVGCVRFSVMGSMHLTCMNAVLSHETDVVHYAAVIPCRTQKEARAVVKLHADRHTSFDAIMAAVKAHSDGSLHSITNPISLTFDIQRALKLISP